jgi:transposase
MSKRGSGERYDAEFKQEAVRLLLTSGKTATQLARELGVSAWSLGRWKQEYLKAVGSLEVAGQVRSAADVEQENRQLRRELEMVRGQRDLLKKAIAICSQDGLGVERTGGMS